MMNSKFKKTLLSLLFFSAQAEAQESSTEVTTSTLAAPTAEAATIPGTTQPTIKNYATRDLITSEVKIYKFSFFSLAGGRTNDIGKGGTSLGSYNYFGLSRKLNSNDQIGVRYVFYFDSAGYKFNPSKFKEEYVGHQTEMGDPYVSYSRYSIAKFSDWNLSGSGRVYLPLSRYSQMMKMVTQLRTELFFDRPLFKFSNFSFSNKTDYFVQTQKAFLDGEVPRRDDGTFPSSAIKGTKQWNTENYFEIDANLSKKVSLKPRLGFEDSWYYGSVAEDIAARHDTDFKAQLGCDYRFAKSLSFSVGLENRVALLNRKDAVAIGRPEDLRWTFITFASY